MLANNSSTVLPGVFRLLSLLSSRALAQHSVTRTKNFSTRARPAPAPAQSTTRTRLAASSTRSRTQGSAGSRTRPAYAGTQNPRGLTHPAQDSSRNPLLQKTFRPIWSMFQKTLYCIAQRGLYWMSPSERNRENAHYERYCFILVTCNMNAKGQTGNENILTVTRPEEESPS